MAGIFSYLGRANDHICYNIQCVTTITNKAETFVNFHDKKKMRKRNCWVERRTALLGEVNGEKEGQCVKRVRAQVKREGKGRESYARFSIRACRGRGKNERWEWQRGFGKDGAQKCCAVRAQSAGFGIK